MIEAIIEVWCSPLRTENYSMNVMHLFAGFGQHEDMEIKEYIDGDFFCDAFGDKYYEIGGLWKVVCKISIEYIHTYDWEECPDTDIAVSYEEIFKSKCYDWTEMKYTWLELNGKAEEYFSKPWKRGIM